MSQYRPILVLPVAAAAAIAANRFVTAARQQAGADANALGVSLSAAATGEMLPIVNLGTAVVEAGAAVTAGATVKADAQGRAIAWATSGARLGVALTAATAAGQLIEVSLIPNAA
jgi:hypothetical protein